MSICGNTADSDKTAEKRETAAPADMAGRRLLMRKISSDETGICQHTMGAMRFPILSRRHPASLFKYAVKSPLALKAAVHTNIGNRTIRVFQAETGVIQTGLIQITVKVTAKDT